MAIVAHGGRFLSSILVPFWLRVFLLRPRTNDNNLSITRANKSACCMFFPRPQEEKRKRRLKARSAGTSSHRILVQCTVGLASNKNFRRPPISQRLHDKMNVQCIVTRQHSRCFPLHTANTLSINASHAIAIHEHSGTYGTPVCIRN